MTKDIDMSNVHAAGPDAAHLACPACGWETIAVSMCLAEKDVAYYRVKVRCADCGEGWSGVLYSHNTTAQNLDVLHREWAGAIAGREAAITAQKQLIDLVLDMCDACDAPCAELSSLELCNLRAGLPLSYADLPKSAVFPATPLTGRARAALIEMATKENYTALLFAIQMLAVSAAARENCAKDLDEQRRKPITNLPKDTECAKS